VGGEKKNFQTIFLKNNKFFPIPKKGSKFHNFTNSCFWGPPVCKCSTTEAQANFPNVLAEGLWSFLPGVGGGGGGGVVALASGHPNTL
jgi:hypothetical protein